MAGPVLGVVREAFILLALMALRTDFITYTVLITPAGSWGRKYLMVTISTTYTAPTTPAALKKRTQLRQYRGYPIMYHCVCTENWRGAGDMRINKFALFGG